MSFTVEHGPLPLRRITYRLQLADELPAMDGLGVLERALAPPEVWLASLGSQWSSLPSFILFFGVLFAFALVAWKFGASLSWDQAALLGSCTMSR